MGLRIDDESLERLPFDMDLQKSLMIYRFSGESPEDFQRRIISIRCSIASRS